MHLHPLRRFCCALCAAALVARCAVRCMRGVESHTCVCLCFLRVSLSPLTHAQAEFIDDGTDPSGSLRGVSPGAQRRIYAAGFLSTPSSSAGGGAGGAVGAIGRLLGRRMPAGGAYRVGGGGYRVRMNDAPTHNRGDPRMPVARRCYRRRVVSGRLSFFRNGPLLPLPLCSSRLCFFFPSKQARQVLDTPGASGGGCTSVDDDDDDGAPRPRGGAGAAHARAGARPAWHARAPAPEAEEADDGEDGDGDGEDEDEEEELGEDLAEREAEDEMEGDGDGEEEGGSDDEAAGSDGAGERNLQVAPARSEHLFCGPYRGRDAAPQSAVCLCGESARSSPLRLIRRRRVRLRSPPHQGTTTTAASAGAGASCSSATTPGARVHSTSAARACGCAPLYPGAWVGRRAPC